MEQNLIGTNELAKQKKILSPKLDVVFQAIFGEVGSEKITRRFLSSILDRKISKIDLSKNIVLRRTEENGKLGILDVFAVLEEVDNCNIEIQLVDKKNIVERILYYWSRVYARDLKSGEDYDELKNTIIVLIANFELEGLEKLEYHSKWKIIEEKERKIILTDKLELHILEMPKVAENSESQDELIDWLTFLENPNSERVQERMKENEELKEAVEKVNEISDDEYMQRIAELRRKAILDEKATLNGGIEKGRKQANLENAKKMLEREFEIEDIIEITGLSREEILKLQNN